MAPETRYARSGDVSIAYQIFGDGPFEVVSSLPSSSHLELGWDVPKMRAYFERLASFARVINFDKRGVGISDRSVGYSSPETRMDGASAHAGAGEVPVSSTVKDLVAGSGLEFEYRGVHDLKGVPGEWRLYAAV